WDLFRQLPGKPTVPVWKAPEVIVLHEENRLMGNFFSLTGGVLVLNQIAMQRLEPLLSNNSEILPLKCKELTLYIVNTLSELDCLDYGNSKVERFPSSGRVLDIERYVFKDNCIGNVPIFRLAELKSRLFATDIFKQAVEENGLIGLIFKKLTD